MLISTNSPNFDRGTSYRQILLTLLGALPATGEETGDRVAESEGGRFERWATGADLP